MIIVTDVNIIISALIRGGLTRSILVNSGWNFCFPEQALVKITKYQPLIIEKTNLSKEEVEILTKSILSCVKIISIQGLAPYLEHAREIMEHIDPEDVYFIAAALSQENAIIWSDDKHFDQQNEITCLKTNEIVFLFNQES